jgi:hypothetical protein
VKSNGVTSIHLRSACAAGCAILAVVTLTFPTWIEALTGLDPDGGNSVAEWMIVSTLALASLVLGRQTVTERRRQHRKATHWPRNLQQP